jgi:hypothetical protein
MADPQDEKGKAAPRPAGEAARDPAARRTYATIEARAAEASEPQSPSQRQDAGPQPWDRAAKLRARLVARLARVRDGARALGPTHAAAGALGALLVAGLGLLLLEVRPGAASLADQDRRLAAVEDALGVRTSRQPSAPGQGSQTQDLRSRVDGLAQTLRDLQAAHAKLASDTRALEERLANVTQASPALTQRIARLEQSTAQLSAAANPGGGAEPADAVRALNARVEEQFAALGAEVRRTAERLETLRKETEARLAAAARSGDLAALSRQIGALEAELASLSHRDGQRAANAQRVVLALELGELKRAMERGERYVGELAAVKNAAGPAFDLTPLERHAEQGVPPLAVLTQSFRTVADRMIDAEAEPAGAGLLERLLTGARSLVRVRKAGHAPDDRSLEAIIGRMEAALKGGRLDEVVAEGKSLPPKAALAAEPWLEQVEAREKVDSALAGLEARLKTTVGGAEMSR